MGRSALSSSIEAITHHQETLLGSYMSEFFEDINDLLKVTLCKLIVYESALLILNLATSFVEVPDEKSAGRSDLIVAFMPVKI
jgi:hypothetical protein